MPTVNRPDTVVRTEPISSATADLSQYGTNLSAATGGAFEATSARAALDGDGRSISLYIDVDNTSSGTIVYHGNTAATSASYSVTVASSVISLVCDTTTVASLTIPGLGGTPISVYVEISTRANPLTTGASDTHTTEIAVYNGTDWATATADHATFATSSAYNLSIGGQYDGTATLASQYSDTINNVRIGARFHASTELAEEISESTSTGSGANIPEPLAPMPSSMGADGEFAGPAYAYAGAQAGSTHRRLLSPLVNYYNPQAMPFGSYWAVRDEITGISYKALASSAVAGFANGPGGALDRARDFTSDYFTAEDPDLNTFMNGTDFVISAWVYTDTIGADQFIFSQYAGSSTYGALFYITAAGNFRFLWSSGGARLVTGATTLSASTWYHLAVSVTHSGTNRTATLYVNGVQDGTGTFDYASLAADDTHTIGARDSGLSGPVDGRIAEIMIREDGGGAQLTELLTFEATRPTSVLAEFTGAGIYTPWRPIRYWRFHQPSDGYVPARMFADVDIGGSTYKAHANLYWKSPVPPNCTHAKVTVTLETDFHTTGTSDTVSVALVSASARPGSFVIAGTPQEFYYTTETSTAATTTGTTLETLTFSTDLKLARDAQDMTNLYVATRIGTQTGDTQFRIKSVSLEPYSQTPAATYPLVIGN